MTSRTTRAMLLEGPGRLREVEMPVPATGENDGLLRIEACGLCGTDLEQYAGSVADTLSIPYPMIPGHEIVGTIEAVGDAAAERWGVAPGNRVAVGPTLTCGRCKGCWSNHSCSRHPLRIHGLIPCEIPPGLWGGYAGHLYLHSDAVLHVIPPDLPAEIAVLFNPLANAIEWSVELGRTQLNDAVLVLGCGQRGLCCVAALRRRGAGAVIVTGLSRDQHKLELARSMGAIPVDVEREDLDAVVKEITGGALADVAIDTTPHANEALLDAIRLTRAGGTVVVAGVKGQPSVGFTFDDLIIKALTLRGASSATHRSYALAIEMLSREPEFFKPLHTHLFDLAQASEALATLAGNGSDPAIAVALTP